MTDERIKEYYEDDDIEDLVHLYQSSKETAEKQTTKRVLLTGLVFFAEYYILFCALLYVLNRSFSAFLISIIPSAMAAYFHYAIHLSIYSWLTSKDAEDDNRIKSIENRIRHAEDNIKAMTGAEIAELFAKRLWHYTDQFCQSAYVSDPLQASVIWASLLYSSHKSLDERHLTRLVKCNFQRTAPYLYARAFHTTDGHQAMHQTMEDTLSTLLEQQAPLSRKQECESFLNTYNILYFDQISTYQDALYNAERYVRIILNRR